MVGKVFLILQKNVFRHKNLFDFWPLKRFIHFSDQQARMLRNI